MPAFTAVVEECQETDLFWDTCPDFPVYTHKAKPLMNCKAIFKK